MVYFYGITINHYLNTIIYLLISIINSTLLIDGLIYSLFNLLNSLGRNFLRLITKANHKLWKVVTQINDSFNYTYKEK